jgi:hypothetical protein
MVFIAKSVRRPASDVQGAHARPRAGVLRPRAALIWLVIVFACPPLAAFAQSPGERDTGFLLTLQRNPDPPPGLVLSLVTTSSYPCEGYTIRSRVWSHLDTMFVDVLGLGRPTPCFQTSSEATGNAFLGNLQAASFVLRISYRGDADLYRIILPKNGPMSGVRIRATFTRLAIR